jgi:glutamine amidotransferase
LITLIDYGSGNISAIANIYERLNVHYKVAKTPDELRGADKLFLPGVGAFDETMLLLINKGFKEVMDEEVLKNKVPIFGICVGMQVLGNSSDEGELPGLGYINGVVRKFNESLIKGKPKLPHMGWNTIKEKSKTRLLNGIDLEIGFYFLHSYYFDCENISDVVATTHYGQEFASVVCNSNVYGVQFHPEKSHSNGVNLLKNFANL